MTGLSHPATVYLVLTLFFTVPSFLLGNESQQTGPPMINVEGNQITVSSNKAFYLFCQSNKPIQWMIPNNPGIEERTKILTKHEMGQHGSNLTIMNATYTDTGRYECIFSQPQKEINKNSSDSVYVFVTSEDPEEMFLPPLFILGLQAYADEIFILPCGVTHPNISVTLHDLHDNIISGDMDFDPEKGFVIPYPSPSVNGRVYCQANFDENSQRKNFIIVYNAPQEKPHPMIEGLDNEQEEIFVGDDFRIRCVVNIPLSTRINLHWVYPALKTNNLRSSVTIIEEDREIHEDTIIFREITSTLNLKNTQLTDSGKYICNATNRKGFNEDSQKIKVLEQGYVTIAHPEPTFAKVREGAKRHRIIFKVQHKPKAQFKWYKDGERITEENQTFVISSRKNGNIRLLTINKVSKYHAGNYTLVGENQYASVAETFYLDVLVSPEITISIDENIYNNLDETYFNNADIYIDRKKSRMLKCSASGNPNPTVKWKWLPCLSSKPFNCTLNIMKTLKIESWMDVISSTNHTVLQSKDSESKLQLSPPLDSGWFLCMANSSSGTIKQEVPFLVTDVVNGFDMKIQSLTSPVLGDNVTLACFVNKYTYNYQIQWNEGELEEYGNAYKINQFENEFSYVSELTILNVTADQQSYSCSVNSIDGKNLKKEEVLTIRELESPLIIEFEDVYQEILKTDGLLSMECIAEGLPRPTIRWFKHDELIDNDALGIKTRKEGEKTIVSTYEINRIQVSDTGKYKCEAINRGGSTGRFTNIEVLEIPQLKVENKVQEVNIGDNVTLQCHVIGGVPKPKLIWNRVDFESGVSNVIPGNRLIIDGEKLFFHNVQASDLGIYRLTASNKINSTYEDISLELAQQSILGQDLTSKNFIIIFTCSGFFALILIISIILLCTKLKKERQRILDIKGDILMMPLTADDFAELENAICDMDYDTKWEFPRDRLNLGKVIGKGAYGRVIKASAVGIEKSTSISTVAVKMLKDDATDSERKALFTELKILIMIGHHINILNLLGAVTKGDLMIILEFCRYGNLAEYLKARRDDFGKEPAATGYSKSIKSSKYSNVELEMATPDADKNIIFDLNKEPLCLQDLICYSYQVARGMEYLHSRRCIHRDLAARNVLLAENNVVKICDFGLARDVYTDPNYVTRGGYRLPIKWMAPESIFDEKVFTQMTDAWSFGIFLWEVFSLGMSPYPGVAIDEDFYDKLRSGFRMGCPQQASHDMYLTMLDCWHAEPEERPNFTQLMDKLGNKLEETYKHEYIDLNTLKEEEIDEPTENQLLMPKEIQLEKDNLYSSSSDIDMYANQIAIEMQQLKKSDGNRTTYLDMSQTGEFNRTDKNYMSMKDSSGTALYTNVNITDNPLNNATADQNRLSTNPFRADLPEEDITENSVSRNRLPSSPYDQNIKGGFLEARLNLVGSFGQRDTESYNLCQADQDALNNFSSKVNNRSDESVASDTSSGFHSDGLPSPTIYIEDAPLRYNHNRAVHHTSL